MRARWLLFFIIVTVTAAWAYLSGRDAANIRADRLANISSGLTDENMRLRDEISGLQAFARDANQRLAGPATLAGADPIGSEASLHELLRRKLAAGISPDRLASVIAAVEATSNCDGNLETAELIVRTELSTGEFSSASLIDNRLVVKASGSANRDQSGLLVSPGYDPTLPVRAEFTHISGRTAAASGLLPLQHTMVVDDRSYRLLLSPGEESIMKVTAETCSYP